MTNTNLIRQTIRVALAVFGFFIAIHLLAISFQAIGKDFADSFEMAFANPAIGLFIGLLGTAILQSSSTTTSLTVAAVAAGSISLEHAIPVVMGANIGTTLTSTIVSMSYVTKTREFKKAVSAGVIHDLFNVLTCVILFPLELKYGILGKTSAQLASLFRFSEKSQVVSEKFFVYDYIDQVGASIVDWVGALVLLVLSIVLLFFTVKLISNILYNRLIGQAKTQFETIAFKNTFKSFGWGFLLTSIIQSSSLTTSLIVPLVATGKVQLKRAFQFVIGANLGTTITALLAALFKSEAAMSLAIAHFLFNSVGMIIFMGIPVLSKIPLYLSEKIGIIALKQKATAFAYIIIVFFLLPFTLIYFSKTTQHTSKVETKSQMELFTNK